jgi:benzodiazapine receptor
MIKKLRHGPEILGAVLCLTAGMLSGYGMHVGPESWYSQLIMPRLKPPSWVFGPVWTLLYILMGVALGKIWNNRTENPKALALFVLQLLLNIAWSPLFFHAHKIDWALYDLIALCGVNAALLWVCRKNGPVFFLLLPYMAWITFACMLNWNIYILND